MDFIAWLWGDVWGRMEFYYYSPSEMFVVLTADQFVGLDGGQHEQQRQDSHVCWRNRTFLLILRKNQNPHYKGDEVKETEKNKERNSWHAMDVKMNTNFKLLQNDPDTCRIFLQAVRVNEILLLFSFWEVCLLTADQFVGSMLASVNNRGKIAIFVEQIAHFVWF